jgi:hypothetical protein
MEIGGLDLHKRESQLSSKADDGTITDRRIVTSRERFTAVLGGRPRALRACSQRGAFEVSSARQEFLLRYALLRRDDSLRLRPAITLAKDRNASFTDAEFGNWAATSGSSTMIFEPAA